MRKGGNAMDSVAVDYELQTTLQKLEKNELLDYVSGVIQQHYLTKKNKYLPIEVEDAYKIKQILKTCQLEEEIVLNEKQSVKLLGEIAEVGEEGYCCSLITGKNNNCIFLQPQFSQPFHQTPDLFIIFSQYFFKIRRCSPRCPFRVHCFLTWYPRSMHIIRP